MQLWLPQAAFQPGHRVSNAFLQARECEYSHAMGSMQTTAASAGCCLVSNIALLTTQPFHMLVSHAVRYLGHRLGHADLADMATV